MDNGAISSDSVYHLHWAYSQLPSIFSPYCFDVQQISTNELTLQGEISADLKESSTESVKLLAFCVVRRMICFVLVPLTWIKVPTLRERSWHPLLLNLTLMDLICPYSIVVAYLCIRCSVIGQ